MNRYTWSIHTVEYYSALKRKEVLTSATTWMKLEDVMLSERSQTQKNTEFGSTHRSLKESDPQETGRRWWGQGLGKAIGSQCSMGTEFWWDGCKQHEYA